MWDWSKCISTSLDKGDCNVHFRHFHTTSIDSNDNKSLEWKGSAFEWTSSVFRPFGGYHGSLPSYPGYSSDFFDDCHYVVLGGSFVTDLTLIRRSFRNWYQNTYRYVFAIFRCVKRYEHIDQLIEK
jgi:formylglycine-generating enzyme required for sulfatase activity